MIAGMSTNRIPHDWEEGRRLRGWELHQQGWKQQEIAVALDVTQGAVSQWLKRAQTDGVEALRHRPPPGPQPLLSPAQLARLPALLARGAEAFGWRGDVWTTQRVAVLIGEVFGVHYHPAHVSRLLRRIEWSCQKPLTRAAQRDEAVIAAWHTDDLPAIKKKP